MPIKKTEAQKQANKEYKKLQLKQKRDYNKALKQKALMEKYKANRFVGSMTFNVPDLVYYNKKNGDFKVIEPLTKANNIKKINKKPVIKLVKSDKFYPTVDDDPRLTPEGSLLMKNYNKSLLNKDITNNKLRQREQEFTSKVKSLKLKKNSNEYNKLLKEHNNEIDDIRKGESKSHVREPDLRLLNKNRYGIF